MKSLTIQNGSRRTTPWLMGLLIYLMMLTPLAVASPMEVSLDQNPIPLGQSVTLTVRIEGKSASQEPLLPDLPPDLRVSGPMISSMSHIVNFSDIQQFTEFKYLLSPTKVGKIRILPIKMQIDGRMVKSRPLDLEVVKNTTLIADQSIFVEAEISPKTAYPGQQVTYIFRIYQSRDVTNSDYAPPKFDGFIEESENFDNITYSKQIKGQNYRVTELRHILFPTRAGQVTIGNTTFTADVIKPRKRRRSRNSFDSLFTMGLNRETERRVLTSEEITLNVMNPPLPKPANYQGLVGQFDLSAKLNRQTIKVGEAATLTINIWGEGNIRNISEPKMDFEGFKVYDEPAQQKINLNSRTQKVQGKRIYKASLIALQTGTYDFEPITLSYLDPVTGRYEEIRSKPLSLQVIPNENAEAPNVAGLSPARAQNEVASTGEDILPLKKSLSLGVNVPNRLSHPLALALFFSPPLLVGGFIFYRRRHDALLADPALNRARSALGRAQTLLDDAQSLTEVKAQARQLDRAIKGYLGDKLNFAGQAQTPDEIAQRLSQSTLTPERQGEVLALLKSLESVQFMPEAGQGTAVKALLQSAQSLIAALDKELK